jgi:8-oxo-dGTP pyrophosphatase MutT (NUDIX family)
MTWYPHKTVAVVVEQDIEHGAGQPGSGLTATEPRLRRFLMVEEHSDGRVVFNQPAGHLEAGETLAAAAVRETLEETAWHVELTGFVGLYQYTSPENGECYIRSCFSAKALKHDGQRELDQDIIQAHWLTLDEITQRQAQLRSPAVLRVLKDYLNGKCMPLTAVVDLNGGDQAGS